MLENVLHDKAIDNKDKVRMMLMGTENIKGGNKNPHSVKFG